MKAGRHEIEILDGRVWLTIPETRKDVENIWAIGKVSRDEEGSWTSTAEDGRSWLGCADLETAIEHLVKDFESKRRTERQRERNKGPRAMFKTTLTLWSAKKPTVGSKATDAEIIDHIISECDLDLILGPDTELIDDPRSDPDGRLVGIRAPSSD
jgi:hypothetical protein